jgi:hypothetical protein
MPKPEEPYIRIIVETYRESGGGLHGDLHVRPISGQGISQNLRVRFPKALRRAYEMGTHFLVYAKVTDREGGNEFVHTNPSWDVEVLGKPGTEAMKDRGLGRALSFGDTRPATAHR